MGYAICDVRSNISHLISHISHPTSGDASIFSYCMVIISIVNPNRTRRSNEVSFLEELNQFLCRTLCFTTIDKLSPFFHPGRKDLYNLGW